MLPFYFIKFNDLKNAIHQFFFTITFYYKIFLSIWRGMYISIYMYFLFLFLC